MCRSLSPSQVSDADINIKRTVWKCHPHLGGVEGGEPNTHNPAMTESSTSVRVVIGAVITLVTVDAEGPL